MFFISCSPSPVKSCVSWVVIVLSAVCWPELGCNIRVPESRPSAEWRLYLSLSHNNPESAPARHCHLLSPVRVSHNWVKQVTSRHKPVFTKISSALLIAAAAQPPWCQLFSECHVSERHSSCLSSTFKSSRNRFCFWAPRTTAISSYFNLLSAFYKDVYQALKRESIKRFVNMCVKLLRF